MEYDVRVLKHRCAKMFVCSSKTFFFKIQFSFSLVKPTLGLSGRMWLVLVCLWQRHKPWWFGFGC